jgi:hypothetical protein
MRFLAGVAAAVTAAFMTMSNPASAQVAGARMAAPFAAPASDVTQVQWRRRYWGGPRFYRGYPYYRRGWGYWGPGFATGLVLGGALAAPYAYGYPYGGYRAYPADDGAVAYCMRRFRSFDPRSMTYLGYDGIRHSCP